MVNLQILMRRLSASSNPRTVLPATAILSSLKQAGLLEPSNSDHGAPRMAQMQELEWLLVGKATNLTYGLILNTLVDQTLPLSSGIMYWDEVLGSYYYSSWYTIQTFPLRLWAWGLDIYSDTRRRLQSTQSASEDDGEARQTSISDRWRQFYSLIRDSVHDRSLADIQSGVLSPFTRSRIEARSKRSHLRRLREMSATGLGMLMDEAMNFDTEEEGLIGNKEQRSINKEEWRSVVSKSVSLMGLVLQNVTVLELGAGDMEETVSQSLNDDSDPAHSETMSSQTARIAARLEHILMVLVPNHAAATTGISRNYGRPSRLIRYWLPGLALFLSSSTLLRIFVKRKAQIISWIRDSVSTAVDFWDNWVVEPTRKIVGTIRHDKDSEIAIMSKESLQGDRASLERMVVDFAIDNPNTSTGALLTDIEIADVRAKVREGDLTPILRAYERDLRKPFVGTIRGDLIRALLIQVQKTKVDVEVAVGGIDNLLKSQELVFGFIGLTPGVLVCFGLSRWLSGVFTGRTHSSNQGSMIRILRNIDRTLIGSTPSENGMLSFKDRGMLLCEAHVLRQRGRRTLPGEIYNELQEEINDLIDLRTGIEQQLRVIERIRWAYSRWLH